MSKSPISIKFLADNLDFKVYSIDDVYLKNKKQTHEQNDYCKDDLFIGHHYGDPNDAIILPSGKHVIVSGCGLSIYNIENGD